MGNFKKNLQSSLFAGFPFIIMMLIQRKFYSYYMSGFLLLLISKKLRNSALYCFFRPLEIFFKLLMPL